ncbi:hypothetical protein HanHA89_Chr17g0729411 [Helianthus annuus]|nr:hypothetical protein HanHA89_Chr17g0729411 [Helianthus annuus]
MKLKQLESLLGNLQQFRNPKIELEQYPTGAHIASRMLYTVPISSLYFFLFLINLSFSLCIFCLILGVQISLYCANYGSVLA